MSSAEPICENSNVIAEKFAQLKPLTVWVLLLGIIINVLGFTSPLFMMIVMDSIVPSQDKNTLFFLLLFACLAFGAMCFADILRRYLLLKTSSWLEAHFTKLIVDSDLRDHAKKVSLFGDTKVITQFVRSGATTLIDVPVCVVAFFLLWMIHPVFVITALTMGVILLSLSIGADYSSKLVQSRASKKRKIALSSIDALTNMDNSAQAMGVSKNISRNFCDTLCESLFLEMKGSSRIEFLNGVARGLRQALQVISLGLGALLVMRGELSGGAMIAGSIILSKALQPIEQVSQGWAGFVAAKKAMNNLRSNITDNLIVSQSSYLTPEKILPALSINNVTVPRGAGAKPVLDRIQFDVGPGECVAIMGPSGSGKTVLVEIIAGVRSVTIGDIKIDNIPYDQISPDYKNAFIGYCPQKDTFYPGTIAQNIARFEAEISSRSILEAVSRVGAEDFIRLLENGFDTKISDHCGICSSSQLKRLNIARAIYASPKVIVFDDPGAGLDEFGEKTFISLIGELKRNGHTIILVAQRAGMLSVADKLLCLENGRLRDFGHRTEVLARLSLNRGQIDTTLDLDEISRISRWLEVQLARQDDAEIRGRAESALLELFNILRAQSGSSSDAKYSIVIKHTQGKIEFEIFCGVRKSIGVSQELSKDSNLEFPRDIENLSDETMSKIILMSMISDIEEITNKEERLIIRITLDRNHVPLPVHYEPKVAV